MGNGSIEEELSMKQKTDTGRRRSVRRCRRAQIAGVIGTILVVAACGNPTSEDPAGGPAPEATISDFTNDTMEQEYADEWQSDDGQTTLVLKDNTFAIDDQGSNRISAGRTTLVGESRLRLETTAIYLEEAVVTDTTEAIDTTEVDELGLEFLGIFTEFAPADSAFTLGSWVTESQFVSQYESTQEAYLQSYIDYIEQIYADLGFDIAALVPDWDDLVAQLLSGTAVDPAALEEFYPEYEFDYSVQETGSTRTFQGEGITGSNAPFASNLPTETNWDTPCTEFTCD
jgi:hypothetical protein